MASCKSIFAYSLTVIVVFLNIALVLSVPVRLSFADSQESRILSKRFSDYGQELFPAPAALAWMQHPERRSECKGLECIGMLKLLEKINDVGRK